MTLEEEIEAELARLPARLQPLLVPAVQSAVRNGPGTASFNETLELLRTEKSNATDRVIKQQIQSLIDLLESAS